VEISFPPLEILENALDMFVLVTEILKYTLEMFANSPDIFSIALGFLVAGCQFPVIANETGITILHQVEYLYPSPSNH